tara:strand:- start:240 stop:356 length:117 start_codon:yes stop_codon:yes gene_type:complete
LRRLIVKRNLTLEIRQGMAMPTDKNAKAKGDLANGTSD